MCSSDLFPSHDNRCVIEIEAWSKEEALMEVESEVEECYSALFADEINTA